MAIDTHSSLLYALLKDAEQQVRSWRPWEREAMGLTEDLKDTPAKAYEVHEKQAS